MAGYPVKPYNAIFPRLFEQEKARLQEELGQDVEIEHFGSTAVPGVGGKGFIDIYIVVDKENMENASKKLQQLGYIKKENAGEAGERIFHQTELPDSIDGTRVYHAHVTYKGNANLQECLIFRDYLRAHPTDAKLYEESKRKVELATKDITDKAEIKRLYNEIKGPVVREIMEKAKARLL